MSPVGLGPGVPLDAPFNAPHHLAWSAEVSNVAVVLPVAPATAFTPSKTPKPPPLPASSQELNRWVRAVSPALVKPAEICPARVSVGAATAPRIKQLAV